MSTPELFCTMVVIAGTLLFGVASLYLLVLTLTSQVPRTVPAAGRDLTFEIIVPARDEARHIGRALDSLRRLDWPAPALSITVVADHCTDQTAALARAAGARVLERRGGEPGKGQAIALALAGSASRGSVDAWVIVDADAVVSTNLLEAFAARLAQGAPAVQARYGVANPRASWWTELRAIAFGAHHALRGRARERLGLSCGLKGNGWCLSRSALESVPYAAYSQSEDLEYGLALGRAGLRVHYADEARADADMPAGRRASLAQRARWRHGRRRLRRLWAWPLAKHFLARPTRLSLDLLIDLCLPTLSTLALGAVALLALGITLGSHGACGRIALLGGGGSALALAAYALRGWQLSGQGPRALLALLHAPRYGGPAGDEAASGGGWQPDRGERR